MRLLHSLIAVIVLVFAGVATVFGSEVTTTNSPEIKPFDLGFIASRHKDVNGDWRLKVLGPLIERGSSTNGMKLGAYRPLYSTVKDPPRDRALHDYVWPVATSRTIHNENYWRWAIFYGFNHETNEPSHRYRFWLLPFYFQSRSETGKSYRALFPVGGTIESFLGRDELSFILFPLYSKSKVNDLTTVNALWPLISRTKNSDDTIYRARFFPFYGVNHHKGKYKKTFILWPIYNSVDYEYPKSRGSGHIVFPLYGWMNLTTEKTLWLLPPFFRFTKGDERNIINAPWPIYRRETGDRYLHYIWPLWGTRIDGDRKRDFFVWPVFWHQTDKRFGKKLEHYMAVPVYSHYVVRADDGSLDANGEPRILEKRHKFWPLYSYSRLGDASRFRFVELWPFGEAPSVERNLAPFWSIYSRYAYRDNVDSELLWGLYRNQKRSDQGRYVSVFPLFDYNRDEQVDQPVRSWNLLKGLIGYERKGSQKTMRLLYLVKIRIGKDDAP